MAVISRLASARSWHAIAFSVLPKLGRLTCLLLRRAASPASRGSICFPQRRLPRGVALGWAAEVTPFTVFSICHDCKNEWHQTSTILHCVQKFFVYWFWFTKNGWLKGPTVVFVITITTKLVVLLTRYFLLSILTFYRLSVSSKVPLQLG